LEALSLQFLIQGFIFSEYFFPCIFHFDFHFKFLSVFTFNQFWQNSLLPIEIFSFHNYCQFCEFLCIFSTWNLVQCSSHGFYYFFQIITGSQYTVINFIYWNFRPWKVADQFWLIQSLIKNWIQMCFIHNIREMWTYWVQNGQLCFDIFQNQIQSHIWTSASDFIFFFQWWKIKESVFNNISESHLFIGKFCIINSSFHFCQESIINKFQLRIWYFFWFSQCISIF